MGDDRPHLALIPPSVLVDSLPNKICPVNTFQQPWWQQYPNDITKKICSCEWDCFLDACEESNSFRMRDCLRSFIQGSWTIDVDKRKSVAQGI